MTEMNSTVRGNTGDDVRSDFVPQAGNSQKGQPLSVKTVLDALREDDRADSDFTGQQVGEPAAVERTKVRAEQERFRQVLKNPNALARRVWSLLDQGWLQRAKNYARGVIQAAANELTLAMGVKIKTEDAADAACQEVIEAAKAEFEAIAHPTEERKKLRRSRSGGKPAIIKDRDRRALEQAEQAHATAEQTARAAAELAAKTARTANQAGVVKAEETHRVATARLLKSKVSAEVRAADECRMLVEAGNQESVVEEYRLQLVHEVQETFRRHLALSDDRRKETRRLCSVEAQAAEEAVRSGYAEAVKMADVVLAAAESTFKEAIALRVETPKAKVTEKEEVGDARSRMGDRIKDAEGDKAHARKVAYAIFKGAETSILEHRDALLDRMWLKAIAPATTSEEKKVRAQIQRLAYNEVVIDQLPREVDEPEIGKFIITNAVPRNVEERLRKGENAFPFVEKAWAIINGLTGKSVEKGGMVEENSSAAYAEANTFVNRVTAATSAAAKLLVAIRAEMTVSATGDLSRALRIPLEEFNGRAKFDLSMLSDDLKRAFEIAEGTLTCRTDSYALSLAREETEEDLRREIFGAEGIHLADSKKLEREKIASGKTAPSDIEAGTPVPPSTQLAPEVYKAQYLLFLQDMWLATRSILARRQIAKFRKGAEAMSAETLHARAVSDRQRREALAAAPTPVMKKADPALQAAQFAVSSAEKDVARLTATSASAFSKNGMDELRAALLQPLIDERLDAKGRPAIRALRLQIDALNAMSAEELRLRALDQAKAILAAARTELLAVNSSAPRKTVQVETKGAANTGAAQDKPATRLGEARVTTIPVGERTAIIDGELKRIVIMKRVVEAQTLGEEGEVMFVNDEAQKPRSVQTSAASHQAQKLISRVKTSPEVRALATLAVAAKAKKEALLYADRPQIWLKRLQAIQEEIASFDADRGLDVQAAITELRDCHAGHVVRERLVRYDGAIHSGFTVGQPEAYESVFEEAELAEPAMLAPDLSLSWN